MADAKGEVVIKFFKSAFMSNQRFKIFLLVDWFYPIGGIEAFVSELIRGLSGNVGIHLVVVYKCRKSDLPIFPENIHILEIFHKNTFKAVETAAVLEKPDIIHVNNPSGTGVAGVITAKRHKIPLIISNHQIPEYQKHPFSKISNSILWKLLSWLDNRADLITVPSNFVAKKLKEKGIRKNIKVISCGVDTARFKPGIKEEAKGSFNLSSKPVILFVGRFGKEKNLELIVKAAPYILQHTDAQFVLVGFDGGVLNQLKELIDELKLKDKFIFMDYLPHDSELLPKIYQAADLFVMPSFFETQSIVTLEAMASGLPIVASNSGALPELVENNINGFLFEKNNPTNLGEKAVLILKNSKIREEMGRESRRLAVEHDFRRTVEEYENAYKSLLKDL